MTLLFAENGLRVNLSDPEEKTMDTLIDKAEKQGYHSRVKKFTGKQ